MRGPLAALVVLVFLGPAAAAAQPAGAKGKPGAKPKPKPEPESEDIHLRAEKQELVEKGHARLTGFVDLRSGELRIQADTMDLYEIDKPDGTKGRKMVAVGNVVFLREEERISGERLEMELETGQGTFHEALGYIQPGVFVEARTIERLDATTYRVEGAKFTSCSQPNPRWGFTASSAKIHVDDKVLAKNAVFKVKSVPAFYVPYFLYPIKEDQRSTGLLFPHFGYSSLRGYNLGTGLFWAMGRSFDQTLYADWYSRFGHGFGHELRYALDAPSRGTFRSYALKPQGGGEWDYDLDWNALQVLPGKFRAAVQVRRYSNLQFQQIIQDNLNQVTQRTQRGSVSLQRSFGSTTFQLLADSTDTYFGDFRRVNRHLPTARLNRFSQKVGRSPVVFGFEARAESLGLGAGQADEHVVESFSRFDLAPELSVPFVLSFLQVTPRAQVRWTRYGKSLEEPDEPGLTGGPLERRFFEGNLELSGPVFSRVFNNPGKWYSDKFKHVIGPEILVQYRTKIDDFELIPKFDYYDQFLGTNQVTYSIVQRFYARRPGAAGGRPQPYEFLTWRLGQTYYVQIKDKQNEFDPNYSSSSFGPGGVPDHNSPLLSRVRFRPTRAFTTSYDLEYDVNFKQLRTQSLNTTLSSRDVSFSGGWSRARRLSLDPKKRTITRNTLRGMGRLDLLPGRLRLEGSGDYDFLRKTLLHSRAKLRYDVQCCGFAVEMIQYNYNARVERLWRFNIELANIGSIGNFNSDDARGSSPGGTYQGGGLR